MWFGCGNEYVSFVNCSIQQPICCLSRLNVYWINLAVFFLFVFNSFYRYQQIRRLQAIHCAFYLKFDSILHNQNRKTIHKKTSDSNQRIYSQNDKKVYRINIFCLIWQNQLFLFWLLLLLLIEWTMPCTKTISCKLVQQRNGNKNDQRQCVILC